MIVVTYTAQRDLVAGHVVGVEYQLELSLRSHTKSKRYEGTQSFTGDDAGTTIDSEWIEHQFETKMLDESLMLNVFEFLNSVNVSETFTIDFDATIAVPNNPKSVFKIFQESIEPSRPRPLHYRFKFAVREFI